MKNLIQIGDKWIDKYTITRLSSYLINIEEKKLITNINCFEHPFVFIPGTNYGGILRRKLTRKILENELKLNVKRYYRAEWQLHTKIFDYIVYPKDKFEYDFLYNLNLVWKKYETKEYRTSNIFDYLYTELNNLIDLSISALENKNFCNIESIMQNIIVLRNNISEHHNNNLNPDMLNDINNKISNLKQLLNSSKEFSNKVNILQIPKHDYQK